MSERLSVASDLRTLAKAALVLVVAVVCFAVALAALCILTMLRGLAMGGGPEWVATLVLAAMISLPLAVAFAVARRLARRLLPPGPPSAGVRKAL